MESLRRINDASGAPREERQRLLGPAFAHTSVGLAIADRDGRFVEANSAFLDIVGRSFEQLSRETVESVTHPDDREANRAGIAALYEGQSPDFQIDKRYLRPHGTAVWVKNSISPLRDDNADPVYTICISENIDARWRAEMASAQARETLELATRAADLGVWDVDLRTGVLEWSPRCRQIFGVPIDAPLTLEDFYAGVHPEDRQRVKNIIDRVLDPKERSQYDTEYRVLRTNGDVLWAAATGLAYFEPDPQGEERAVRFIGVISDVSQRRRAVDALIQAEKLAATGRLAASIAHEINNPLEAVVNLLFLLREAKEPAARETYLELAEQEIKRVAQIATQTLRFYRDPAGPTVCDVNALLNSVLTLFHGRAHLLGVDPHLRLAECSTVFGSQGELRQVFVNLVSNALDAMPKGGRLYMRTRIHRARKSGVRVTIADTGEGMDAETRSRLFRPFFTTKSSTGTGLGLWLSLEILNKHNATIRVRSKRSRGTVMSIFFPNQQLPELKTPAKLSTASIADEQRYAAERL
ncbi:MAG TPA: PAS domain-containing protein [Acidobacteriaceae bacterium]